MRIDVALVALLAAGCATARPRPPSDPCGDYVTAMRPPMADLSRAADAFGDGGATPEEGARKSHALATRLREIAPAMRGAPVGSDPLRAAHGDLMAALDDMARSLWDLGDVLQTRAEDRREGARIALKASTNEWGEATRRLKTVCPAL